MQNKVMQVSVYIDVQHTHCMFAQKFGVAMIPVSCLKNQMMTILAILNFGRMSMLPLFLFAHQNTPYGELALV
jgi:hypothetical protein